MNNYRCLHVEEVHADHHASHQSLLANSNINKIVTINRADGIAIAFIRLSDSPIRKRGEQPIRNRGLCNKQARRHGGGGTGGPCPPPVTAGAPLIKWACVYWYCAPFELSLSSTGFTFRCLLCAGRLCRPKSTPSVDSDNLNVTVAAAAGRQGRARPVHLQRPTVTVTMCIALCISSISLVDCQLACSRYRPI